nr:hypothetical protein [uncultured Undibacterium sp.]
MLLFDKWPYRDNSLGGILIDVLLALVVAIFNGMAKFGLDIVLERAAV